MFFFFLLLLLANYSYHPPEKGPSYATTVCLKLTYLFCSSLIPATDQHFEKNALDTAEHEIRDSRCFKN